MALHTLQVHLCCLHWTNAYLGIYCNAMSMHPIMECFFIGTRVTKKELGYKAMLLRPCLAGGRLVPYWSLRSFLAHFRLLYYSPPFFLVPQLVNLLQANLAWLCCKCVMWLLKVPRSHMGTYFLQSEMPLPWASPKQILLMLIWANPWSWIMHEVPAQCTYNTCDNTSCDFLCILLILLLFRVKANGSSPLNRKRRIACSLMHLTLISSPIMQRDLLDFHAHCCPYWIHGRDGLCPFQLKCSICSVPLT